MTGERPNIIYSRRYRKRPNKRQRRDRRLKIRMKRYGPGAVMDSTGLNTFSSTGRFGCNAAPYSPTWYEIDSFLRRWNRGKLWRRFHTLQEM